jgi:hypothetical protein
MSKQDIKKRWWSLTQPSQRPPPCPVAHTYHERQELVDDAVCDSGRTSATPTPTTSSCTAPSDKDVILRNRRLACCPTHVARSLPAHPGAARRGQRQQPAQTLPALLPPIRRYIWRAALDREQRPSGCRNAPLPLLPVPSFRSPGVRRGGLRMAGAWGQSGREPGAQRARQRDRGSQPWPPRGRRAPSKGEQIHLQLRLQQTQRGALESPGASLTSAAQATAHIRCGAVEDAVLGQQEDRVCCCCSLPCPALDYSQIHMLLLRLKETAPPHARHLHVSSYVTLRCTQRIVRPAIQNGHP